MRSLKFVPLSLLALALTLVAPASAGAQSSNACAAFSYNLYFGLTDAMTGGEVSRLQSRLGGQVTGYFGPMTEQLVQRWQAAQGVVSSGSADTTGYGAVGPRTRALMATNCNLFSSDSSATDVATSNQGNALLYAEFVNSTSDVTVVDNGADYAEHEITLQLTASDADVYVTMTKVTEDSTLSSVAAKSGWNVDLTSGTLPSSAVQVVSDAPIAPGNASVFLIKEGETEEFTISAISTTTTGQLKLGAIQFGSSVNDLFGETLYVNANEFRTPNLGPVVEDDEDHDPLDIDWADFEVVSPSRGPAPLAVHVFASIDTYGTTCGPMKMGTLDWGDGSRIEEVVAERTVDRCKKQAIDNLRHTYVYPGKYTLKFKDFEGETHTASVIVSPAETVFKGIDLDVAPYGGNAFTFLAEVDLGKWTNYTYELDWGEGDSSVQTKRSKVVTVCNSEWTCSSPPGQVHEYATSGLYTISFYALKQTDSGISRTLVKSVQARASTEVVPVSVKPTLSVTASNDVIVPGDQTKLTWTSKNATRCFLQYGNSEESIAVNGTKAVAPSQTTTHRFTCVNEPGNGKDGPGTSKSVTIQVESENETNSVGVVAVGVYEGTYSASNPRVFQGNVEGTVYVNVSGENGMNRDLVLTSYEPVNWVLNVDDGVEIGKIIVTGYNTSRVTNAPSGTDVEIYSYAQGGKYYYAYQSSGDSYVKLKNWLTGLYPDANGQLYGNFVFPGYSAQEIDVYVGYKG